jgi:hypothetical protein
MQAGACNVEPIGPFTIAAGGCQMSVFSDAELARDPRL